MKKYLIIGGIIVAVGLILLYLYKNNKTEIKEWVFSILQQAVQTFHSLGRVKLLVTEMAIIFLFLFSLMIGLTQDYLTNEFEQFNRISMLLVSLIFGQEWATWMGWFGVFSSAKLMIPVLALIEIWILYKGKNKRLETMFLFIIVFGGTVISEGLHFLFKNTGPVNASFAEKSLTYSFPNQQASLVIVIYGLAAFFILRYSKNNWIKTISLLSVLLIAFLVGLNHIFFQIQYPSDIVAGYVFGGMWLSFNLVLLEVFRLKQL